MSQLSDIQNLCRITRSKISNQEREMDRVKQQHAAAQTDVIAAEESITNFDAAFDERRAAIFSAHAKEQHHAQSIGELRDRVEDLKQERGALVMQLESSKVKVAQINQVLGQLQQELNRRNAELLKREFIADELQVTADRERQQAEEIEQEDRI